MSMNEKIICQPLALRYESPMKTRALFSAYEDERRGVAICERFPGELRRRVLDCSALFCLYAGREREELLDSPDVRQWQWSLHDESELRDIQADLEAGRPYVEKFIWRAAPDPLPGSPRFEGMINRCHGQTAWVGGRLICRCQAPLVSLPWSSVVSGLRLPQFGRPVLAQPAWSGQSGRPVALRP